jgi:hypothetical protein
VAAWPMWRDMNMSKLAWRACRHNVASTPADCDASKNSFAYFSEQLDGRRSCVAAGECGGGSGGVEWRCCLWRCWMACCC